MLMPRSSLTKEFTVADSLLRSSNIFNGLCSIQEILDIYNERVKAGCPASKDYQILLLSHRNVGPRLPTRSLFKILGALKKLCIERVSWGV
jgi:hypothetical protein